MTGNEIWIFEGIPEVWMENDRSLVVAQLQREDHYPNGLYVRFCSWRDDGRGHEVAQVEGRRLRITVEVLDDA